MAQNIEPYRQIVQACYHTNPDFADFNEWLKINTNKGFTPYDSFTSQSMEERCQLLYELVKIIWEVE